MSTYTQAAPQAYPPPTMATISGGFAGTGSQAEQFANVNVINQLTTSNDVLDDGTGVMTVNAQGNRTIDIASFMEPNIQNPNTVSIAVGKTIGASNLASELTYNATGSTTGFLSVQMHGQAPIFTIDQTSTVRVGNTALYNSGSGNGTMTVFPSGSTSQVDLGVFQTALATSNFALFQLGVNGSAAGSAQVSYTNNGSTATNTAGFGLAAQSPQIVAVGNNTLLLPLVAAAILVPNPANGPKLLAIDPTNGLLTKVASGTGTLNGITPVVIATGAVTSQSNIFLTPQTTSVDSGFISVSAKSTGSFSVVSSAIADTNTFSWFAC